MAMPELTEDQVRTLADGFFAASQAVGEFRLAHFTENTMEEQAQLRTLQNALRQQSIELTADAIRETLERLKPTLEHIGAVTKQVNEAVAKLKEVRQVITIATSFVNLGGAIVTGNPAAIAAALGSTVSAVEASEGSS
jgi:septal ring factor EnvC (AmiA/AmiB activator)